MFRFKYSGTSSKTDIMPSTKGELWCNGMAALEMSQHLERSRWRSSTNSKSFKINRWQQNVHHPPFCAAGHCWNGWCPISLPRQLHWWPVGNSISHKTSYEKISLSLEGVRSEVRISLFLWNVASVLVALLPGHQPNSKMIKPFLHSISRVGDFARSYDKTSSVVMKLAPGSGPAYMHIWDKHLKV